MSELEQLRADLQTLEAAAEIAEKMACVNIAKGIDSVCVEAMKKEIAALEAEQAEQADPWKDAKDNVARWQEKPQYDGNKRIVALYVCHLEAELAKMDEELRCERIDGGKVRDDLRAENERLKKKGPLYHPFRNAVYRINVLSHALEDMLDKHVPDWNEDTYHALLEKAQQDILDIPLSGEELEWYKTVDARNIVKPKTDTDHLRKKLAELITIYNAIPPACPDAQALVQARIDSVKKEMQGNE